MQAVAFGSARARVGVDIGGTFTDAALEVGGVRHTAKVLTTRGAPDDGVVTATERVLEAAGLGFQDIELFIHGTTLATNALIERKGAPTAMITTAGFRDVLQIALEHRFELYDLFIDLPTPLVGRDLRLPVRERIGGDGSVLLPLDEADVAAAAAQIRRREITSVAVCFLHSYANPTHEQRVGELLARLLPGVAVSLSCEVAPEMREYERFTTAVANAYVRPMMEGYLDRLQSRLRQKGLGSPMLMMLSGGGLTTVETASRFPVRLVESGPAGGAVFSAAVAAENGLRDVVSFDMGGTTAKVCLIENGRPQTSRTFEVARIYRFKKGSGMPIRIPVIDMVEIGAGGGSIAHIDALGRLAIGPESAGSEPGPIAYGRGGVEPTVTDADLAMGRINPSGFAGGRFPLDRPAATAGIVARIGAPMSIDAEQAAAAIADVVEENMAAATRVHAIESGRPIAEWTLIAFGGAAPLHVASVARKVGMKRFLVPTSAGVGSAVGFLRAPVSYEIARTLQRPMSRVDFAAVNAMLAQMSRAAHAVVEPAAGGAPLSETRKVSMRYVGQGHEIEVPLRAGAFLEADRATIAADFESRYRATYGRIVPGADVEVLTWSLLLSAPSPVGPAAPAASVPCTAQPKDVRRVFDPQAFASVEYAIHWRPDLRPGARIDGPAIIEEDETSTLIPTDSVAIVLASGALLCELESSRSGTAASPAIPEETNDA